MSKHVVEKAKDVASDLIKRGKKKIGIVKNNIRKSKDSYISKIIASNKKADERAEKKNLIFSTSTPDGSGRTSNNPKATKNGGII